MRSYHRQRLALLHKAAQHRMEHEALEGWDQCYISALM